jgi:multimeric flavodoxin WrbA
MAKARPTKSTKRVLILCGSPRPKGNTNTIAGWVAEGARAAGAKVETVDVARLKFKANGCTACFACQRSRKFRCVIRDEATSVLARIPQADAVVFATPTYFFGPTAQLKLLLDRMYSLWKFQADKAECAIRPGAVIGLIATAGGGSQDGIQVVEQTFKILSGFTKLQLRAMLVPNAPHDPKDLAQNATLRRKAGAFGRRLLA